MSCLGFVIALTPDIACQQYVKSLGIIDWSEAFGDLAVPQAPHHARQHSQTGRVIIVWAEEKKCQIRWPVIGGAKVLSWPQAGKNSNRLCQTAKNGVRDRNIPPKTECWVLATGANRLLNRIGFERSLISRDVGIASAGMQIPRVPPSARWLKAELDRAKVVNPSSLPDNVIAMHSIFDFYDGITDQVRRATLVYPGEEDQGIGRISILLPLGSALIGLVDGKSLPWRGATGEWWTLRVIQVIRRAEAGPKDASIQP